MECPNVACDEKADVSHTRACLSDSHFMRVHLLLEHQVKLSRTINKQVHEAVVRVFLCSELHMFDTTGLHLHWKLFWTVQHKIKHSLRTTWQPDDRSWKSGLKRNAPYKTSGRCRLQFPCTNRSNLVCFLCCDGSSLEHKLAG